MPVAGQQGRGDESGADVRKADIQLLHMRQLRQCVDVGVLHAFGGRVGRCTAESFGACDRTDDGQMPASVSAEIAESRRHHAHESFAVGVQGVDLDVGMQLGVAFPDARTVQVNVHSAQLVDQA